MGYAHVGSGKCRIIIAGSDLGAYTSSVPTRNMLRELVRLRPEDEFLVVGGDPAELANFLPCASNLHAVPVSRLWENRYLRFAGALAGTFPPGIQGDVYIRFDAGTFSGRAAPLIALVADLSALGGDEERSLRVHGRLAFRLQLRRCLACAARIVAVSEFTKGELAALDPGAAGRIVVISNGIEDRWYRCQRTSVGERAEDPGYWIWYGQITPRKNLARLLRAYRLVLDQAGKAACLPHLRIVGKFVFGRERPADLVEKLGLQQRVKLVPPQPLQELVSLVAASRGLVFPSLHEGFGMPIVEAMACGVPVLTSDRTAMPEVAGGHAVLCDPENERSIASGLAALLAPAVWRPEKLRARRNWARRFTAEAAARAYSRLIDEVWAEHEHRARRLC